MAFQFNWRYYIVSLGFLPFILNQTMDSANSNKLGSELFYCADWNCEEILSTGKTLLTYVGKTEQHLSFRQNEDIRILAKPVEDQGADWIGMVKKKVGLVPKTMIREDQMGKRGVTYKFPLNTLPIWADFQSPSDNGNDIDIAAQNVSDSEDLPEEVLVEEEETTTKHVDVGVELTTEAPEIKHFNVSESEDVKQSETEADEKMESSHPSQGSDGSGAEEQIPEVVKENRTEPQSQTLEEETTTTTAPEIEKLPDIPEPELEKGVEEIDVTEAPERSEGIKTQTESSTEIPQNTGSVWAEFKNASLDAKNDVESEAQNVSEEEETSEEILEEEEETTTKPVDVELTTAAPETKNLNASEDVTQADLPEKAGAPDMVQDGSDNEEELPEVVNEKSTTEAPSMIPEEASTTTNAPEIQKPLDLAEAKPETFEKVDASSQTPEAMETQTESSVDNNPDPDPSLENVGIPEIQSQQPDPDPVSNSNPQEIVEEKLEEETQTEAPTTTTTSSWLSWSSASEASEKPEEMETQTESSIDNNLEPKLETDGVADNHGQQDLPISNPSPQEVVEEKLEEETQTEATTTTTSSWLSWSSASEPEITTEAPPDEVGNDNANSNIVPEDTTPATHEAHGHDHDHNHVHDDHDHHHDHDHQHGHHHHSHAPREEKAETSSFITIVKHLSSTLLSFLPEHLQDTILDVDDALVFTGIIALTLISICVPYFLIEGFFAVRPLKKKVVELNKTLWKVSTAFENQQDEFEQYKKKALAYDEDKKRVEQLEYELVLLKKLEGKQKEQVAKYQKELKTHKELTGDMQSFLDKEAEKKRKILEEKEKLKTTVTSLKEALRRTVDDMQDAQAQASTSVMEFELSRQANETLGMKVGILEKEVNELKSKLMSEVDKRRAAETEQEESERKNSTLETELTSLKQICHQYEETVSALNTEISNKENELLALQETMGEDSPLIDIADAKAKLVIAEELASSTQKRVETLTLETNSLSRNLKETTESLSTTKKERDEALNRLQVLESWFKEKEEDLRRAVERYEAEKNIRGKGKDDLVQMLEEKSEEIRQLQNQLELFKVEFEENQQVHRNEIRNLETKSHENWLSLCQAERKAQDARKEAELLRQKLTAITKEKEGDGLNGEVQTAVYPLITPDMVPLPLPDDAPSYFGLGEGFMPPPPLPLDDGREPHRPAPLGRVSPTYSDLDDPISPIHGGRGHGHHHHRDRDYSDGNSSGSDSPRRRSPRGWNSERDRDRNHREEERHRRRPGQPSASSPLHGFNL